MTRIIIEVPENFGPFDLDAQILQPLKDGGIIPIFCGDVMPGERVIIKPVYVRECLRGSRVDK